MNTILITEGAGFIGAHLARLFETKYPQYKIVKPLTLTYSNNPNNLTNIENTNNYTFVKGDITNISMLHRLLDIDFLGVLYCAAKTHVDRSIKN